MLVARSRERHSSVWTFVSLLDVIRVIESLGTGPGQGEHSAKIHATSADILERRAQILAEPPDTLERQPGEFQENGPKFRER